MLKNFLKSIATMSFVFLAAQPAAAQPGVRVDVPLPGLEIRVGHKAPPRLRSEQRPARPGRDYLWLPGSWDWRGNDWDWAPGRWERPSERGQRWVKARYIREGSAWRHEPAHWSNQKLTEGDDYRRWKTEKHPDQDHGRDRDKGRDNH